MRRSTVLTTPAAFLLAFLSWPGSAAGVDPERRLEPLPVEDNVTPPRVSTTPATRSGARTGYCGADKNAKSGDFEAAMSIWESPLAGLKAAIRKAAEMGIADPRKVGFTGLSHGSEIGAFSISHSDLFQAASMSGAGSWDPLAEQMVSKRFRHWLAQWGLIDENDLPVPERFEKLSATLNADRIHTPLLVNAPDSEYIMALPLYTAMHDRRKPVELWVYPDEYHEKIQPKHRYSVYERNVDWFKFWLKGEEEPDSAKKAQYERWRKLRELHEADLKKKGSSK